MPIVPRFRSSNTAERIVGAILSDLSPQDSSGVNRRTLENALRPVEETIRNTTPVDTGRLRDSTTTISGFYQGNPFAATGWSFQPSELSKVLSVEFGNSFQRGQRVIRNAYEQHRIPVTTTYRRVFAGRIRDHIRTFGPRARRRR